MLLLTKFNFFLLWATTLTTSASGQDDEDEVRRVKRRVVSAGFVGGLPFKNCDVKREQLQKVPVFVDEGDTVVLGCPICAETSDEAKDIKWWRLPIMSAVRFNRRITTEALFTHAKEVDVDVPSKQKLERVYIGDSDELYIKQAQAGDEGSYFCQTHTEINRWEKVALDACKQNAQSAHCRASQQRLLEELTNPKVPRGDDGIVLYYVDIELPPPSIIVVKRNTPRRLYENVNLEVYNQWSGWSVCDAECNTEGYRTRKGKCVAKRYDRSRQVGPAIIDDLMAANRYKIIECHSTFLYASFRQLFSNPDQLQRESCTLDCGLTTAFVPINVTEAPKEEKNVTRQLPLRETLLVRVGERLILRCPNIDSSRNVVWFNGTTLLSKKYKQEFNENTTRWEIIDRALVINPVEIWDEESFSCWIRNRNWAVYTLVTKEVAEVVTFAVFKVWFYYLMIYEGCLFFLLLVWMILNYIASCNVVHAYQKGADAIEERKRKQEEIEANEAEAAISDYELAIINNIDKVRVLQRTKLRKKIR